MAVPRILLLVLALLQATGIAETMRRQACEEECRKDGCGDDCAPGNDSPSCPCHCPSNVSHVPPLMAVAGIAMPTEGVPVILDRSETTHLDPDPREISHVPRHVV